MASYLKKWVAPRWELGKARSRLEKREEGGKEFREGCRLLGISVLTLFDIVEDLEGRLESVQKRGIE